MPSQTIHQFLARLNQLRLAYKTFLEDDVLMITITSSDFTEGEWEHGEYGDTLVEYGEGWQLEIGRDFTIEDLLNGVDNGEGFFFQPCLIYHSLTYYWPDTGNIDRDLNLAEIEQMIDVLMTGDFPHDFFDEDSGEL